MNVLVARSIRLCNRGLVRLTGSPIMVETITAIDNSRRLRTVQVRDRLLVVC